MVQDPNFWRRFSVAVHQDEASKELEAQNSTDHSLKHAYVSTPPTPCPSSPPASARPRTSSLGLGPPTPYTFPSQPSSPVSVRPLAPQMPAAAAAPPKRKSFSALASHLNASTLSFAGRNRDQFRFCTTITADASCRDSWLESQNKKARHRSWMCWAFWLTLISIVVGVVVAVLLLRARGII